jgi:hypothetical protein
VLCASNPTCELLYEIEEVYQYFDSNYNDLKGCTDISAEP